MMELRNRIQGLVHLTGEQVQPSPHNFRTHNAEQKSALRASMERLGVIAAGIVRQLPDGSYQAVDGHLRGAENQTEKLPWLLVDLNEEEAKEAILMLDPISAMAGTDAKVLDSVLQSIDINDETLQKLCTKLAAEAGLYKGEIDAISDDDAIPSIPTNPVTKRGDVWVLGEHRVMCGDSTSMLDVTKLLNNQIPLICVTDPPYGTSYQPGWRDEMAKAGLIQYASRRGGVVLNDDRADWLEAYKLFPGDIMYVWHAHNHGGVVSQNIVDAGFQIRNHLVWRKPHFAISRGDYHWQHEALAYSVRKGKPSQWCGDRSQSTIWDISNRLEENDKTDHGTQKPLECMARPIRNHGNPGDGVYDPFGGSLTTLIAAQETGRTAYVMELSEAYCDVGLQRYINRYKVEPVLEATGQTFTQVKEERHGTVSH